MSHSVSWLEIELVCLVHILESLSHIIYIQRAKHLINQFRVSPFIAGDVLEESWIQKKGTPNTTRVTLYSTILGYAEFISSTHRKCRMFLSSLTAIARKAFSMSATSAIGWTLNLMGISRTSRARGGPVWRQSFNAGPFPLDALYTMLGYSHDAVMGKVMYLMTRLGFLGFHFVYVTKFRVWMNSTVKTIEERLPLRRSTIESFRYRFR